MKKIILGGFLGGLLVLLALSGYVYFGMVRPFHAKMAENAAKWDQHHSALNR